MTARVAVAVVLAATVAGIAWCASSIVAWQLGAGRRRARLIPGRDGRGVRIVRFTLVAGQLGVACVLLAGAALLGRSYVSLLSVDIGMDERTETLTVAHDPLVPASLRLELTERILGDLRAVPGVQAAGASYGGLLDGRRRGRPVSVGDQLVFSDWHLVAGDYFEAMGLRFVTGSPPAPGRSGAVINESMARRYFGEHPPIGEALFPLPEKLPMSIVGVVRDVRSTGLSVASQPAAYQVGGHWGTGSEPQTTYVVRVAAQSSRTTGWERTVQHNDPLAVVLDSGAIRDRLDRSVRDRTFATVVVGLFSVASVFVTALGLAGVVAYTVVKRTREIAVRLSLGATRRAVTQLVVREAATAGVCGVLAGAIASVWLSRFLESVLYNVSPAEPWTLLLSTATLLGVVLAAAMLPALRAARIDPATALRIE